MIMNIEQDIEVEMEDETGYQWECEGCGTFTLVHECYHSLLNDHFTYCKVCETRMRKNIREEAEEYFADNPDA